MPLSEWLYSRPEVEIIPILQMAKECSYASSKPGPENFPVKHVSILGFVGHLGLSCNYSTLMLQHKSSPR